MYGLALRLIFIRSLRRDGRCCATSDKDCVERAHLCPRSQAAWLGANGMGKYNLKQPHRGDDFVDDVCNAMVFRSNVHKELDDRKFVCVPPESRWIAHLFNLTNTLERPCHNTVIELDPGFSLNFPLGRFAMTFIPLIHQFLRGGAARNCNCEWRRRADWKKLLKILHLRR